MGTLTNETTISQCEMIVNYIKNHGSITQDEASYHIGCARLPARINDLRNRGYHIKTEMKPVKNRWGKVTRVAVYTLEDNVA